MMLTKSDLSQIRKIVREEVEIESDSSKQELLAEIKLARMEIQNDINVLIGRVKNLEIGQRKILKDIKLIINTFDREYLQLRKEVNILKDNLNVSSLS